MLCVIWYHLYTNGGVLILVKLQAYTNSTKSRKASQEFKGKTVAKFLGRSHILSV